MSAPVFSLREHTQKNIESFASLMLLPELVCVFFVKTLFTTLHYVPQSSAFVERSTHNSAHWSAPLLKNFIYSSFLQFFIDTVLSLWRMCQCCDIYWRVKHSRSMAVSVHAELSSTDNHSKVCKGLTSADISFHEKHVSVTMVSRTADPHLLFMALETSYSYHGYQEYELSIIYGMHAL